jgi:hypothetical protein
MTPATGTEATTAAILGRDLGQLQTTIRALISFAVQLRRSGALFDVGFRGRQ